MTHVRPATRVVYQLLGALAVLASIFPLYYLLINSIKPYAEVLLSFIDLPTEITLQSYVRGWQALDVSRTLFNSLFITAMGVLGIATMASLAAYKLARTKTWYSVVIFYAITFSMIVPFHTVMIPLARLHGQLGTLNTHFAVIFTYWGMDVTFAIFIIHGFVKNVPRGFEDAATVDGCGPFRMFFQIVFPMLRPIIATIAVLQGMWFWNDFLLPMLMLRRPRVMTIPVAMYSLWGEWTADWPAIFAAILIAITPILVFFFVMQKHIVRGIAQGGMKG